MKYNKFLVEQFYAEIWNKKNFSEIPNILNTNFIFRGSLGDEKKGHAGFKGYVESVHTSLGNYNCLIEDIVVDQQALFAKMVFSGLHQSKLLNYPATHKYVSWHGAALFKFSDMKISSLWVLGDLKNLEDQLSN